MVYTMHYQHYDILSLNVNGLNNPIKRGKMIAKMKKEKINIAFWQETHMSAPEHDKLKKLGFRNAFFSSYRKGKKRGVCILISNSTPFEYISEIKDKEGRFILVKGKIDQKEVTLLNIYAPPGTESSFFRKIFDLIALETYGTLICAGDFNVTLNPVLDTTNINRKKNCSEKLINRALRELGLKDVWRTTHRHDPGYTFYSGRHATHSRLDYFFMYDKDLHRLKDCKIGQRDLSDHSGVYITIHFEGRQRKTLWRLNTGLLNDANFQAAMVTELGIYLQENDNDDVNPSILWDASKAVLRGKIIARTAISKKLRAQTFSNLQEKLKDLEQLRITNSNPDINQQIRNVKQDIDKILSEEVEKKLRFLKQRYYEAGPKATRLLAWRLRKQQAEQTIHKIRDPITNKITSHPDGIQKAFEKYYKALYTRREQAEKHTIIEFLNSLDLPSIGKEVNNKLIMPISKEEIDKAILSLNSNKSPGTDGFPPEWYKAMREHLVPLLETCFNYILTKGSPPPSWREAFISVIPKEGKDRMECKAYRPISVLNTDYKLYATILTKRLETAMPLLIDEDQTGFIKNRQTQDNIRRALHTIEHINREKLSSMVLSFDAEKAFDSVG